ncbi:sigma-70 family RNA polymerase sigma factor [Ciceribacter sp. L1K23]|uniref:sigma-70 family RNA polymerase sigma factor n=1 Tax=Ciceribacter sp. L1K23 TaxID=2820276 RepID=UPI001B8382E2|nr:sigma-70 family RNA polymerase sigma factor [Ciceribacter sp. L1K23]MBR0557153.1 sigma-70 family RNA polymerase sigma factor [Ciceribacter sp. L1K23]
MMSADLTALLGRIALKDRDAFAGLYRETGPKLFAVCIRMLRDRAEAEDALQEVFVRIWQRADTFAGTSASPMAWLCSIARHYCIDRLRVVRRPASTIEEAADLVDPGHNPETVAVISSEGKRIDRCMEQLESERAQAVRYAYVEGLSYQELADRFEVPLNTMRTWLRRSLLKLRECLET